MCCTPKMAVQPAVQRGYQPLGLGYTSASTHKCKDDMGTACPLASPCASASSCSSRRILGRRPPFCRQPCTNHEGPCDPQLEDLQHPFLSSGITCTATWDDSSGTQLGYCKGDTRSCRDVICTALTHIHPIMHPSMYCLIMSLRLEAIHPPSRAYYNHDEAVTPLLRAFRVVLP